MVRQWRPADVGMVRRSSFLDRSRGPLSNRERVPSRNCRCPGKSPAPRGGACGLSIALRYRMRSTMRSLAADEADFTALESPVASRIVRRAARWGTTLAFVALFLYCTRTAWGVLGQLGHVTLAEGLEAFRVVSVRAAIA